MFATQTRARLLTLWSLALWSLALLGAALPTAHAATITIYTSEVQADVQALADAYQAKYPADRVQIYRSGTGEVTSKLSAELTAGNPQPDIVWVADSSYLDGLRQRSLLAPLSLGGLNVPAANIYGGGTYAEVRKLYNVIGVNTRVLAQAPRNFADLMAKNFQGKLAMPNPLFSGGALATAGALSQRLGWNYFAVLARNGMRIEQSNPITTTKLINGEYGAAILVDYALRREAAKGAPLQVVYPREGAILVKTPVAILKASRNAQAAQNFVRFLYSRQGQELFSKMAYVPVMPGVTRPVGVPAQIPTMKSADSYVAASKAQIGAQFSKLFDLK